jgi:hypothetical protein
MKKQPVIGLVNAGNQLNHNLNSSYNNPQPGSLPPTQAQRAAHTKLFKQI